MSFELTTIGQYASVQGGYAFKSQDFSSSGFRPVLKIKNVRHGHIDYSDVAYVSEDIANGCKRWETTTGDILISMTGSGPSAPESLVGRVARVWNSEPKSLINQRVGRIVLKDDNAIDKDFIFYVLSLRETQEYLVSNSTGSANQVNINAKTIESVSCPIVTFEESQQIASIFKTLDRRIRLLRETNATLEAIAQALFKSWFVDFDPVHANAAFLENGQAPSLPAEIQALFPSRLVESPQGLIPEGWEVATLDDVSEVGIGKTPPRKEQHWFSENSDDIRWVSIRDMGESGAYLSSTNEYLTKEAVTRFNVRVVPDNTVMLSFKMTIGRVAISDGEMTTNEAIAHFKLTETSPLSSEFIYLHLKSFDYSTLSSTSSIADAVNSKTVKNIPIVLPVKEVLREFQSIIHPVMQRIKLIEQQIKTVSNLRDTLLPRLISGQLRLPEAEAALAEVG